MLLSCLHLRRWLCPAFSHKCGSFFQHGCNPKKIHFPQLPGSCGKLALIGFHTKMYGKSTEWFTRWKNRIFCCLKSHNEANDIFLYAMQVALINYDDVIKVIILNAIIVCILHFYCIRFYFYTHITVLSTKSNFNCANNLKQKAIIFQLRYHGSPWSAWHAPE